GVPSRPVRRGRVRLVTTRYLLRCPGEDPCGRVRARWARVPSVGLPRRGCPHSCEEQEEHTRGQREEQTFHLVSLRAVCAPVTVHDTSAGTWTDSSHPGRSIAEPNRPRGLGIRACRIRRPRPGAASTKNPVGVA